MRTVYYAPIEEARRSLAYGAINLQNRSVAKPPVRPAFASREHERFYDSQASELVASAWMGAGKSRVLCQKAWDLARTYPGATLGLFRKVAASLPATTERTFWRDVADLSYVRSRNRTENWVELVNGSRIYFMGLDADPVTGIPSKVGSLDLDWAGVDEAVELNEQDWMILGGRLRRTAMPYRQLAAATNPAAPTHWLKRRFTPPTDGHEWVTITENSFLPPDYIERLASLGTGAHAQRLAQGLWVAAEGQIWSLPDDAITHNPGPFKRVVAGIDWGFVHAFACEVVGQTGSGKLATLGEVYVKGALLEEVIPRLLEMKLHWNIETFYADPSEPQNIVTLQRAGLPVVAATNDVVPGIEAVAQGIANGMTVSPACVGLLGEIPGYTWAQDRGKGVKEVPVKVNDDACDAWRYACMALRVNQWGSYGSGIA